MKKFSLKEAYNSFAGAYNSSVDYSATLTEDEKFANVLMAAALLGVTFVGGYKLSRFISTIEMNRMLKAGAKAYRNGGALLIRERNGHSRTYVAAIEELAKLM